MKKKYKVFLWLSILMIAIGLGIIIGSIGGALICLGVLMYITTLFLSLNE